MNIKPLPLLRAILALAAGSASAQEAYLTVNAGAHTGLIRQIIVDGGTIEHLLYGHVHTVTRSILACAKYRTGNRIVAIDMIG